MPKRASRWPEPRRPQPLIYEMEIIRLVDPDGAAAFDRAKSMGFLVVGNDVGPQSEPRVGFCRARWVRDQTVWETYRAWCRSEGRPLIWVGVVMTRVDVDPVSGVKCRSDPAADLWLAFDSDEGLDDEAKRCILDLPGRCEILHAKRAVHIRAALPEATLVAARLFAIAVERRERMAVSSDTAEDSPATASNRVKWRERFAARLSSPQQDGATGTAAALGSKPFPHPTTSEHVSEIDHIKEIDGPCEGGSSRGP